MTKGLQVRLLHEETLDQSIFELREKLKVNPQDWTIQHVPQATTYFSGNYAVETKLNQQTFDTSSPESISFKIFPRAK